MGIHYTQQITLSKEWAQGTASQLGLIQFLCKVDAASYCNSIYSPSRHHADRHQAFVLAPYLGKVDALG